MPTTPTYAMAGNRGSIIPAEPAVPINPTQQQLANREAAVATKPITPTVVSDATFREDTKPQLNTRLNALQGNPTPQTQTQDTPLTATPTADGKWEVNGETYDASPMYSEDPQQNAIISALMQKTDAQTKQMIGAITQQASVRKAQQEMVNKSAEASTNHSLLLGGASRYAPITAGGINANMQSLGISKLADLDAQEQAAIASAKQAQANQEYDLMGKALTTAENIRQEKQTAAKAILDQQTKDNEAARQAQMQASRDSAISGLLAQGITDPNQILNYLNYDDNGNLIGDFTAKEVADTLGNLHPEQKALTDLITTARNNGAPPDVLAKIGSSADLNSAYQAAGSYGAGGSGIVGEFNYAKANGYTGSFSQYQNEDANRKAKATGTSGSGAALDYTVLTPEQQTALKTSGFTSFSAGVQDLASQLVTGKLAPSELSKRTTGSASYNDVLSAANAYSKAVNGQSFDISKADRNYKYANAPATQNTLNYLSSLVGSKNVDGSFDGGNLSDLITLSDSIDRGKFPALNDATQWAKLASGDPQIAAYYTTMLEVSDQVAKILQGGGSGSGTSDAKLAQAAALFQKGFNKDQVRAVASSLQPLLTNRAKGMIRDNPYLSDYASDFGISQNLPGQSTSSGNPADAIVMTDQQAVQKIASFVAQDAANQALMDDLHAQFPDKSATWIAEHLKL